MSTRDADNAPSRRSDFVGSVASGLSVLSAFTPEHPEMGVSELTRVTGLDKRKTQRLISTLLALGFVEQDPYTRKYRPGVGVLRLGFAALESLDVRQVAMPYLRQLMDRHGQSVNLAVRDGEELVFVECLRGRRYALSVQVQVGERLPVHVSSLGRAMLSRLAENQLTEALDACEFVSFTPYTVRSRSELLKQLERARRAGYAVMDQETSVGVRSVGAPVLARGGAVVAAINVAMPTVLMTLDEMERTVAPSVVEAARSISQLLGQEDDHGPGQSPPSPGATPSSSTSPTLREPA